MRSFVLAFLGASLSWAQAAPSAPQLVGAGFSNPFPILVAPGQVLTLFVEPPAGFDSTAPMPSIGAVYWNGSDEAMPVLQVHPSNTGCTIPAEFGGCPSLLA